jgi:hypothetical protein
VRRETIKTTLTLMEMTELLTTGKTTTLLKRGLHRISKREILGSKSYRFQIWKLTGKAEDRELEDLRR